MGQVLSYIPDALQGHFLKCDDDFVILLALRANQAWSDLQ